MLMMRSGAVLVAAVVVPASLLAGWATTSADVTAESARRDVRSLLERTLRATSLEWSSPWEPTRLPCTIGARMRDVIHAPITAEQRAVADELAAKRRAEDLRVERSEQDFGPKYGTVHAATVSGSAIVVATHDAELVEWADGELALGWS